MIGKFLGQIALLTFLMLGTACFDGSGETQSVYIPMPDGVRIAADIHLPDSALADNRVPTMVRFTRYWRARETEPPQALDDPEISFFNSKNYAFVTVDVRGTGASFGKQENIWSVDETRDFSHVIEWIAKQAWSNGAVATIGTSYGGNTSENATFDPPAALRAAIPRFTDFDWYTSILFPGGIKNKIISSEWGANVYALDMNDVSIYEKPRLKPEGFKIIGVRPVDGDHDRSLLAQAVSDHQANVHITELFSNVEFRDDLESANSLEDPGNAVVSSQRFRKYAAGAHVPTWHWGSWMDAGTAAGVLARFASGSGYGRHIIGAWNHGADSDANPFLPAGTPVSPTTGVQYEDILNFLSPLMKAGSKVQQDNGKTLAYFTMGENAWKQTEKWPPAGSKRLRFYLAGDNRLVIEPPIESAGSDHYSVDFDYGTGPESRWTTQLGGTVVNYGDRRTVDNELLAYTSRPMDQPLEITGFPVMHLYLSSTTTDGAVIAYLQDVAPDGTVRMITEGHLRLINRKVSDNIPEFPVFSPYHTFLRKDALPMIPGHTALIAFSLLPTSVLIDKGHSLRIAIAGHDKDVFIRIPEDETPVYTIERNAENLSFLELPVIEKEKTEDNDRHEILSRQLGTVLGDFTGRYFLGSVLMIDAPEMERLSIAAGFVDRKQTVPMSTSRGFQIGSQTKMFTAAAILLLAKEGRLKLSDPVTDYFDDVPGDRSATIANLLTHSSGFGDGVELLDVPRPAPLIHFEFEDLQLLSRIQGKQFDAGQRFQYNNFGFDLLGEIVEKLTGKPVSVFIRERFLKPLGMQETYTGSIESRPVGNMARGYEYSKLSASAHETTDGDLSWAASAGDMISSSSDMMKWMEMLASPDNNIGLSLADFTTGRIEAGSSRLFEEYGFGLMHSSFSGLPVWGHGGFIHGYISFSGIHEASGLRFSIMTSLRGEPDEDFGEIFDRLVEVVSLSIHLYTATGQTGGNPG